MNVWSRALAVVALAASCGLGQALLSVPERLGQAILGVGDTDGDGDRDVLRVSPQAGVEILRNDGLPGFATAIPLANTGTQAIVADLTADGIVDITLAAPGGPHVYAGIGGGSFSGAPLSLGVAGTIRQMLIGDVNGDSRLDLAVHSSSLAGHRLEWFVLTGSAFTSYAVAPLVMIPARVLALDATGNGLTDLLVFNGGWVDTFLATGTTVAPGPSFSHPGGFGGSNTHLVLVDFDADGDRDLAFVQILTGGGAQIGIFAHQGGFQWTPLPVQIVPGVSGDHVHATDWNGDGAGDLWLLRAGGWTLLANDGLGTYSAAYGVQNSASGAYPYSAVTAADLSGDGVLDLIAHAAWLPSHGLSTDPNPAMPPGTLRLIDAEGDGDPDLLVLETLTFHLNDGTGAFSPGPALGALPPPPAGQVLIPIEIADFDADGDLDVLATLAAAGPLPAFIEHRSFLNAGGGVLVNVGLATPATGQFINPRGTLDWNADGNLDFAGNGGLWIGDGLGHFTQLIPPGYPGGSAVGAGDFNGDGAPDVLTAVPPLVFGPGVNLRIALNGGGNIALPGSYAQQVVRIVDLDRDGDLDIIAGTMPSGAVLVFDNSGTGTFAMQQVLTGGMEQDLGVGDFDGDGQDDVFVANGTGDWLVHRRLTTGPWLFAPPRLFEPGQPFRAVDDVDGDGDADILGSLTVVRNLTFEARRNGGSRRQYGAGAPGTSGIIPTLGATGPFRTGQTMVLRGRSGFGAAPALLLASPTPSMAPLPGTSLTVYVGQPLHFAAPVPLAGAPGVSGSGRLDLPLTIPAALAGQTVYLQLAIGDPGVPAGISATNGLELMFGL